MTTAIEQFTEDFLLVVMNDQDSYNRMLSLARKAEGDRYELAHLVAVWYEWKVEEIVAGTRANSVTRLLVTQIMDYWSADAFIKIADVILEGYNESLLKTEVMAGA